MLPLSANKSCSLEVLNVLYTLAYTAVRLYLETLFGTVFFEQTVLFGVIAFNSLVPCVYALYVQFSSISMLHSLRDTRQTIIKSENLDRLRD